MKKAMVEETRGSALILTTILLFVVLSIVVSLSYVTVMEQKMSQKTKSSVGAFYNSESGVEWALNQIATKTGPNISNVFSGFSGGKISCPSGFNCDLYLLDDQGKVIAADTTVDKVKAVRSVGTQDIGDSTQRSIEAAVAAGGSGCFTYYCGGKNAENSCTDAGGTQKFCPSGWDQKLDLGHWGLGGASTVAAFFPPGGGVPDSWNYIQVGRAFLCCQ
jgi:Tfp pilus assembly protein PilX